jgi:hypothetical protein
MVQPMFGRYRPRSDFQFELISIPAAQLLDVIRGQGNVEYSNLVKRRAGQIQRAGREIACLKRSVAPVGLHYLAIQVKDGPVRFVPHERGVVPSPVVHVPERRAQLHGAVGSRGKSNPTPTADLDESRKRSFVV